MKNHARFWCVNSYKSSAVLLCVDPDNGGREAVVYWRKQLKNARSLSYPEECKDASDMLLRGNSLTMWLGVVPSILQYTEEDSLFNEYRIRYLTSVFANPRTKMLWMCRFDQMLGKSKERTLKIEKDGIVYMEGVKKSA